jgi:hypothetical protein
MTAVQPEALTAAAIAIHDASCPDQTCGGAALGHCYRLAGVALEAAAATEIPTGTIHLADGKLGQAELDDLAAKWRAAWDAAHSREILAAAGARIAELEQLAAEMRATFHDTNSDGWRARTGRVTIARWDAILAAIPSVTMPPDPATTRSPQ